jgi:hypothetical protein
MPALATAIVAGIAHLAKILAHATLAEAGSRATHVAAIVTFVVVASIERRPATELVLHVAIHLWRRPVHLSENWILREESSRQSVVATSIHGVSSSWFHSHGCLGHVLLHVLLHALLLPDTLAFKHLLIQKWFDTDTTSL